MSSKDQSLKTWGMVWQRDPGGMWERHLIRKTATGRFVSDTLVYVDATRPICLHCLSQDVDFLSTGELKCMDCKVQYSIVEER